MKKFTSRKFLTTLAGVFTGIGLIISGDTTEGVITLLSSIVAYLVAEGYVDANNVSKAPEVAEKVTDAVEEIAEMVNGDA